MNQETGTLAINNSYRPYAINFQSLWLIFLPKKQCLFYNYEQGEDSGQNRIYLKSSRVSKNIIGYAFLQTEELALFSGKGGNQ